MFGWKPKTPEERRLKEVMDKIKNYKKNHDQFVSLLGQLSFYIPVYTNVISNEISKVLVMILDQNQNSGHVSAVLDSLVFMFDRIVQTKEETKPFHSLLGEKKFFHAMFKLTDKFDARVIRILTVCLQSEPLQVSNWVKKNSRELRPLCTMVAATKNNDAGRLLHHLAVSQPELINSLSPFIKPLLTKYPVATVIDFMIASEEMKKVIPANVFEKWLLEHNEFTISDIECVVYFHEFIWDSETTALIFSRTVPSMKMRDVEWIHKRSPPKYVPNEKLTIEIASQIAAAMKFHPDEQFKKGIDCDSTRDPYIFVRLFVLSLCNPEFVKTKGDIVNLLCYPNDWVVAGALQVLGCWAMKYQVPLPAKAAFRVADIIMRETTNPLIVKMARGVLHALTNVVTVAGTMLQNVSALRMGDKDIIPVKRESWTFPNYMELLPAIPKLEIHDYNDALNILGYVSEYFDNACVEVSP